MLSKNLITLAVGAGLVLAVAACKTGGSGGTGGNGGSGGGAGGTGGTGGNGATDMAATVYDFAGAPPGSDLSTPPTGAPLYDSDGPEQYSRCRLTATGTGKSVPIVAWSPATAGPRPLVVVSAGLQQPGAAYAPTPSASPRGASPPSRATTPASCRRPPRVADDIAFLVGWAPTAVRRPHRHPRTSASPATRAAAWPRSSPPKAP